MFALRKKYWLASSAIVVGVSSYLAGCLPPADPYQKTIKQAAHYASAVPSFTGPGTSTPLPDIVAADHPGLAARGYSGMHSDAAMSGTHPAVGPVGSGTLKIGSANMSQSILGAGECGNTTFNSQGLLISFCADFENFKIYALKRLVDAQGRDRFLKVAEYAVPERESSIKAKQDLLNIDISVIMNDTSGGAYFHLDDQDRVVLADATNKLQILELNTWVDGNGNLKGAFTQVNSAQLGFHVPNDVDYLNPNHHDVTNILPDWNVHSNGAYWFVTRQGLVGTVTNVGPAASVQTIDLGGEEIQNAMAIDATGVYVVSDHAMYKYTLDASSAPQQVWRQSYDRGTGPKPGQLNQGSGTTPTLMGANNEYVGITDNADPINVVVYDRTTGELVCEEPVFMFPLAPGHSSGLSYASATDNSLIGYNNSLIVENNWGYRNVKENNWTQPGLTRVDVVSSTTNGDIAGNCVTTWENTTEASQSVVPKLSLGNGLVYIYTREDIPGVSTDPQDEQSAQAYYFGALDYASGELVYKKLTGTGENWNNNYAPITIGPDGTAYVGVFNGIISIRDI